MKVRLIAVFCIVFFATQASAAEQGSLMTEKDRNNYSIGYDIGKNLKRQPIDIDPDILIKGMKDGLSGDKALMTDQEIQDTLTALRKEIVQKLPEINKKAGEAFLAKNKSEKGVKTLKSGLQYRIISEGSGKKPKETDTVTVHYRGTLIDGTEFDSSYKRGQPATFAVGGVIKGWTEALQLMKEGSKWQLFIPSALAYGESGRPGIPPNAVLIFEVELISIKSEK